MGVRVTMLVNAVVFTPSEAPGVNSHRHGGGQGRNPGNCRRFSTLRLSWCLKSVNSDMDPGGRGHDPCNCRCFQTLGCCWILKSVNSHRDCLKKLGCSWMLKRVNSHRDGGGRGRNPRNCRRSWMAFKKGGVVGGAQLPPSANKMSGAPSG